MSSGKMVTSEKEVKERRAKGEVLISHKEAQQEAKHHRDRIAREQSARNQEVLKKASYLLNNGYSNVAQRVERDYR